MPAASAGWLRARLRGCATLAIVAACTVASARASADALPVRGFTSAAWQSLLADRTRARIVVFTGADCNYCAAEVARIAAELAQGPGPRPVLAVVFMDGPEAASELLAEGLYPQATEAWALEGDEAPVRYRIDPSWRGETPYIALLPRAGKPWFVLGHVAATDLARLAGGPPVRR